MTLGYSQQSLKTAVINNKINEMNYRIFIETLSYLSASLWYDLMLPAAQFFLLKCWWFSFIFEVTVGGNYPLYLTAFDCTAACSEVASDFRL